jgi:3-polyprenyl-4-hydroxybenzoate decarboxylase
MFLGSAILFVWARLNKAKADAFGPAVASGLICGDGIWTLPQSILALAKVNPPICMKFLSRATNAKVDSFLGLS